MNSVLFSWNFLLNPNEIINFCMVQSGFMGLFSL